MRDTRRGTQSYMEKRRGRREIEVTRRRRGGIKTGESKLASNHFPMCAPQSGPLRDVHEVTQRRGRKETEVARRIKGGIKKMQERFNKDLEEIKKSQCIINNAINEIKNTLEGTN